MILDEIISGNCTRYRAPALAVGVHRRRSSSEALIAGGRGWRLVGRGPQAQALENPGTLGRPPLEVGTRQGMKIGQTGQCRKQEERNPKP